MPNVLYASGNYLVTDTTGVEDLRPKGDWAFVEDDNAFYVAHKPKLEAPVRILKADAGDWENDSAVDYTESTLRDFLQENTGVSLTPFSFGSYLASDGSDDYVSLPPLGNSATKMTVSFWCYRTSGQTAFLGSRVSGTNGWDIYIKGSNELQIRIRNGGSQEWSGNYGTNDVWAHFMISWDAGTIVVYRDGVVVPDGDATAASSLSGTAGDSFEINRRVSVYCDSHLNEMAFVMGYAGTAQDAIDLYNGGDGAYADQVLPSVDRYYRCNQEDGDTSLTDSGSDGSDGTLNNYSAPYFIEV